MSDEELKTELERLRNENAALKKGVSSGIRLKVSEKGAVSVYGMGRFGLCCVSVKSDVGSVLFRALKTHPDFIGNSPRFTARSLPRRAR